MLNIPVHYLNDKPTGMVRKASQSLVNGGTCSDPSLAFNNETMLWKAFSLDKEHIKLSNSLSTDWAWFKQSSSIWEIVKVIFT